MNFAYRVAVLLMLGAIPVIAQAQTLEPCGKNHFILAFRCATEGPETWTWSRAGDMRAPREGHTATLLADGRVLVAGGYGGSSIDTSTEIYDPAMGTWTSTGEMRAPRSGHTAVRLLDGRVLVAGGFSTLSGGIGAELYDPRTGAWAPTGPMQAPRAHHAMTLLADGTVLVTGGMNEDYFLDDLGLRTAEIYDPVSDAWRNASSMRTPRYWHTMTLLADGNVLVAGGATLVEFHGYTGTAELYSPSTDSWIPAGHFGAARSSTTATALLDGSVMVAGGYSTCRNYVCSHAAAAIFEPLRGWGPAAPLNAPRSTHTTTRLANGQLLVIGGDHWGPTQNRVNDWYASAPTTLASTELYDPATGAWIFADDLSIARIGHTATLLGDGTILVVGGRTGGRSDSPLASTEVLGPSP